MEASGRTIIGCLGEIRAADKALAFKAELDRLHLQEASAQEVSELAYRVGLDPSEVDLESESAIELPDHWRLAFEPSSGHWSLSH